MRRNLQVVVGLLLVMGGAISIEATKSVLVAVAVVPFCAIGWWMTARWSADWVAGSMVAQVGFFSTFVPAFVYDNAAGGTFQNQLPGDFKLILGLAGASGILFLLLAPQIVNGGWRIAWRRVRRPKPLPAHLL